MRVLVTGGAGFVGQYLARHLVGAGHDLAALDLLRPRVHPDPGAAFSAFPGDVVVGDVADEAAWVSLTPPHAIVHLAAEHGAGRSLAEQDRARRVNVHGTALAGRFAAQWGVPLVALSSRSVYGQGRHACPEHGQGVGDACCTRSTPVASREDDAHRPVSVDGETRSLGEARLAGPALRVPVTILRPQDVVGPAADPHGGLLASYLTVLRASGRLRVPGNATGTRDLVHVDDVARLVAWAVDHPGPVGSPLVLNAGTGVRTTQLALALLVASGGPVEIGHDEPHPHDAVVHACADLGRLHSLGAPVPAWTPADAVSEFLSWGRSSARHDAIDHLADRGLPS